MSVLRRFITKRPWAALVFVGALSVIALFGGQSLLPSPTDTPEPTATAVPTAIPTPTPALSVIAAPRRLVDLRQRVNPSLTPRPALTPVSPHDDPIGTERPFWFPAYPRPTQIQAHVVVKTDHAYWYVQDGLDVPTDNVNPAATYFEKHTYPTEHRYFGSEETPGIDNDQRITILVGDNPTNGFVAFFGTADVYPTWVSQYSNQRRMIYVDPHDVRLGSPESNAQVAASYLWMIEDNVHRSQDFWILDTLRPLAAEAVTGSANDLLSPYAISSFQLLPQTQLNDWSPTVAHDAATYLFAKYVVERFGGYATIGKVLAEPGRGIQAFDQFFRSLNPPTTFDQIFADWVAANELDDPSLADGRFAYASLHLSPKVELGPTPTVSVSAKAVQFGASYFRVEPKDPVTLVFTADRTVKLTGTDPHDGGSEWWSNRGDQIDTHLTRTLDLRSVTSATLHFWTWFEIEKDFDYAYVEVSLDNGTTWRTLAATDTTQSNPYGLNLGDGFTGPSGGGAAPKWVHETVDLTPYASHEILIRFEYVTDYGINLDGFVLDGIEVPEIGFRDANTGNNGWAADGFIRTDNVVPQPYLVEVLSPDHTTPVRRLSVGSDGQATVSLAGGQSVIVAVSGLSPYTTQPSQFQLSLTAHS